MKSYLCTICNKNYTSYQSMWNHNKKFHKDGKLININNNANSINNNANSINNNENSINNNENSINNNENSINNNAILKYIIIYIIINMICIIINKVKCKVQI